VPLFAFTCSLKKKGFGRQRKMIRKKSNEKQEEYTRRIVVCHLISIVCRWGYGYRNAFPTHVSTSSIIGKNESDIRDATLYIHNDVIKNNLYKVKTKQKRQKILIVKSFPCREGGRRVILFYLKLYKARRKSTKILFVNFTAGLIKFEPIVSTERARYVKKERLQPFYVYRLCSLMSVARKVIIAFMST
jgi:hypothetical protein